MKICLINNLYKPYIRGGAEMVMETIHNGLSNMGHDVFVISTAPKFKTENKAYRLKSQYYNLGKMPLFFRLFWHFYDMFDFFTAQKAIKIIHEEKPDLVITNNLKGISFLLPFFIKKSRIQHIHIIHDAQLLHPSGLMMHGKEKEFDSLPNKFYIKISKYLFSFCGSVVSPSQWLLDLHLKYGFFNKIQKTVIPNPVNIIKPAFIKTKTKTNHRLIQFLYVGQIEKYKGVEFLVNSFVGHNDIGLTIVGDGSFLNRLKQIAKDSTNIIFTGRKSREEVSELMQDADCLIVPSLCYENSPTVIYEAMAANLPVLGSRIGGITEFLDDIGGMLFEPGDKKDLLEKIDLIIKNPQKIEDLKKNYTNVIDKYTLQNYLNQLLKNLANSN